MLSGSAAAQDVIPARACSGRAAVFEDGKAFKLWLVRRGSLVVADPLRPLSSDPTLVLHIIVNGRVATAHGPDFTNLRRGGPPAKLEEESGEKIRWEGALEDLPSSLRIVAEDGRVVFERLAFSGCEDAPAVRAPPSARPRAAGQTRPTKPPVALPQGAIP